MMGISFHQPSQSLNRQDNETGSWRDEVRSMVIVKAFNKVPHLIKSFNYNRVVQSSCLKGKEELR